MSINQQDFRINLRNLQRGKHGIMPPSDATLLDYYRAGMVDAERFLRAEGYYDLDVVSDKVAHKANVALKANVAHKANVAQKANVAV